MQTMQFRDYIFRHNPAVIKISAGAKIAEHFCPGMGSHVRNIGAKARTVTCAGSFLGGDAADAVSQAAEFRRKTAGDQSGMLFLPGMEPFPAQLSEFVMEAGGDGRILPYTIVFIEQEA